MTRQTTVAEIGAEEAGRLLAAGGAVFVDIRDPDSFRQGRIPGAVHLTDETLQTFLETADKDRLHVVYCYHGNASRGAAAYLASRGFRDIRSLAGGFEEWRRMRTGEAFPQS